MADFETSSITVESFIRGYHVSKDVADWDPQLQEERVLKREPNNKEDNNAVAVVRPLISLDISESQKSSGSPRTSRRARQTFHSNTVDEQKDEILGRIPLRMPLFVRKVGRDRKASKLRGWLWLGNTVYLHIFWRQKYVTTLAEVET